MSFDTNILNVICEYIDDAKTYFNFALVCRKTRYVTKLRKNSKMNQFTIENDSHGFNDGRKCVERRLPNGRLHDVKAVYYLNVNGGYIFYMYYNGICLADWFIHSNGFGKIIEITHYKCDCTKGFENSYTNDKIGLDGVVYKLHSTITKSRKCYTCGENKVENEQWSNFEYYLNLIICNMIYNLK